MEEDIKDEDLHDVEELTVDDVMDTLVNSVTMLEQLIEWLEKHYFSLTQKLKIKICQPL